jgi:hypothetical protein
LEAGEGRRDEWKSGGCCRVRARYDAFVLVFVVAVEVGFLIDIDAAHFQWLTGDRNIKERLGNDCEEETYGGGGFSSTSIGGGWTFISYRRMKPLKHWPQKRVSDSALIRSS